MGAGAFGWYASLIATPAAAAPGGGTYVDAWAYLRPTRTTPPLDLPAVVVDLGGFTGQARLPLAVRQDPAGNLKPDKEKSTERIDGIVSMVMAVGRAMVNDDGRSVYEDMPIRVI